VRILVVAATAPEIAPLVAALDPAGSALESGAQNPACIAQRVGRVPRSGPAVRDRVSSFARGAHDVDMLTTGVGMLATAAWVSRAIVERRYDLALNLGVCGSFRADLAPGVVVHVTTECLPEMGAEDGERFLPIEELGLLAADEFPCAAGRLCNVTPPQNAALAPLPRVDGITVNTVHGEEASIARVVARLRPDVETMEGAAFMYACLVQGLPFAEVRAVSNIVERRNRAAWRLGDAIRALGETALAIIDHA
jgi:futalosine hydrolase